jgi:diphosphomevalonate decarboxylase
MNPRNSEPILHQKQLILFSDIMTLSAKVEWDTPVNVEADGSLNVRWLSPSNIAIVKYWGKQGQQLPANPSVSLALRNSLTSMELHASPSETGQGRLKDFHFEDQPNADFARRFETVIQSLHSECPFLANFDLSIKTSNTFPHSAGIASSASGFSALALCICTLERDLLPEKLNEEQFLQRASCLARLGSGSACRSVYPGFSLWGETPEFAGSDDRFAIPVNENIHNEFTGLGDAVLLISTGAKAISSSMGHSLMKDHPYLQSRINQANGNISLLAEAMRKGDWNLFIQVTESEALSLHALMLSSTPGFILMGPNTIEAIRRIREYRKQCTIPLCFTLDAGPNVHLIYRHQDQNEIKDFIRTGLLPLCEDGRWIDDKAGTGPKRIR